MSRHIPFMRMVDEHTIKTREGALMQVLAVEGWPFETTDDDHLDALKQLKNVVYRGIASPTTAIYTHVIRRKTKIHLDGKFEDDFSTELNKDYREVLSGRTLYENALYLTIIERPDLLNRSRKKFNLKSGPGGGFNLPAGLNLKLGRKKAGAPAVPTLPPEDSLQDTIMVRTLNEKSSLLAENLKTYGVRRLGKDLSEGGFLSEPLSFLYELINGERRPVALPRQSLADYLPANRLIFGRESIHVRGAHQSRERFAAMVSIKEYGPETIAGMFDQLLSMPFEYVMTQSFSFEGRQKAIEKLETTRRKYASAGDSVTLEAQLSDAKDHWSPPFNLASGQRDITRS